MDRLIFFALFDCVSYKLPVTTLYPYHIFVEKFNKNIFEEKNIKP